MMMIMIMLLMIMLVVTMLGMINDDDKLHLIMFVLFKLYIQSLGTYTCPKSIMRC